MNRIISGCPYDFVDVIKTIATIFRKKDAHNQGIKFKGEFKSYKNFEASLINN